MRKRKWLKVAVIVLLAGAAGDFALSSAMRLGRIHRFLTARLESAFGRSVQVGHFALRLLPSPRIEAEMVTVGEDPSFGYEYFLRAERVTAGLRWIGLLRGRFELSTFSFTRPSLTLVRNEEGRWNLERWLPPARSTQGGPGPAGPGVGRAGTSAAATFVGPMPLASAAQRLKRVEFDDGRINFVNGAEKLPFAFIAVAGSVQQETPGRWELRLEAQPWRSGAMLQAAGTLQVRGEIAGTSARLQPAEIQVHWGEVSLADLLRLARGQDFGLRGAVNLDAALRSKATSAADTPTGDWAFSIQARARAIHRWNLTERRDNPAVNVSVNGTWNVPASRVRLQQIVMEGPRSNARAEADGSLAENLSFELRINSAGIQAADALAWYRAFHPGVAEGVAADGYLTGAATVGGWPLALRNLAFSSSGGRLAAPGLTRPVRIGVIEGGRARGRLVLEPVRVFFSGARAPRPGAQTAKAAGSRGQRKMPPEETDTAIVTASHDLTNGRGSFSIEGEADHGEDVLAIATALGRPIERGWELEGKAAAALRWDWGTPASSYALNGHIDFSDSRLQVAGLNLPLEVNAAQLVWKNGERSVQLGAVEAFGATWDGELEEDQPLSVSGGRGWKFQLHADNLDATELDRWVGPRARPNWLEQLLTSLLGSKPASAQPSASELIRRIRAEGELRVDDLRVEKLRLNDLRALTALHDFRLEVRDAAAQWAGGAVRGSMMAEFSPRPRYRVNAALERIRLADLPGLQTPGDRLSGFASGEIHIAAEGVGRDELLQTLEGEGRVRLRNVEFRGWDVAASLADGAAHSGASRWLSGEGGIAIREGAISLDALRLDSAQGPLAVSGAISFGGGTDLVIERQLQRAKAGRRASAPSSESGATRVLKITGPLDVPLVSVEKRSF